MLERTGERKLRFVFVPRHVHARVAMHSLATVASGTVAVRMAFGGPWWIGVAWYFGSFLAIHAAMVPVLAMWYMVCDRYEGWIRGIVEQELIRFDLQSYDRQLKRVLPEGREVTPEAPEDEHPP